MDYVYYLAGSFLPEQNFLREIIRILVEHEYFLNREEIKICQKNWDPERLMDVLTFPWSFSLSVGDDLFLTAPFVEKNPLNPSPNVVSYLDDIFSVLKEMIQLCFSEISHSKTDDLFNFSIKLNNNAYVVIMSITKVCRYLLHRKP